ncbi:MAG: flagellar hook-basal body complex protein, partial [Alphaproteobacteria bacterium]|nr:flagellar hook-basal body complex protein [Alphaproteobacteria bacterium]
VVDTSGGLVQLLPVDASGSVTSTSTINFVVPQVSPSNASANLSNISIGSDGLVTATFSDGSSSKLGKVALATISTPQALRQLGNSHWAVTSSSGPATIAAPGTGGAGVVQSGALELSNVDLTAQLVDLIAAQQNYQANAKALNIDSQLAQSIINIQG